MSGAHWRLFWVIVAAGVVSSLISDRLLRRRSADILRIVPQQDQ